MKFLLVFFLFISLQTFAQKKVNVKSKVEIVFENFQDTIFRGYDNPIYLKGISDLKGITVEASGASVKIGNKEKKQYILIPGAGKTAEIVVKKNGKEVVRKTIIVTVLQGKQLEYLKKKNLENK
jgi:hypothetical protein